MSSFFFKREDAKSYRKAEAVAAKKRAADNAKQGKYWAAGTGYGTYQVIYCLVLFLFHVFLKLFAGCSVKLGPPKLSKKAKRQSQTWVFFLFLFLLSFFEHIFISFFEKLKKK